MRSRPAVRWRVRESRVVAWTALSAALLAAAGALLPVPPELISNQLDAALGAALHFAAAHGSSIHPRPISTFGPLGFVFYGSYFPATFAWLLGLRAVLAVPTCWTLAWLGYAAWGSPWGGVVALIACTPFLASPDVWFLTLPLLALLIELPTRRAPLLLRLALAVAIGLASLIKFTVLLAAVAVVVPLAVADVVARRPPVLPAAALISAALAWLAIGYSGVDALNYLDWSWREISAGYSTAMQLPAHWGLTAHAVAVGAALFVCSVALMWQRHGAGCAVTVPALAAVLFLLFKAGFVRFDVHHVSITTFGFLVLAVLLGLLWARRPAQIAVAATLVALLLGSLLAHAGAVLRGSPLPYLRPIFPLEALRRVAALPLLLGGDAVAAADAQRRAWLRAEQPLPPLMAAVDIYPIDQGLLLAHDLDFRPRPVVQSYMAYSARLAHANAQALLGAGAPEWILFRVAPIDRRLPALDDAPSWPLLMTRYRLREPVGRFALLQRRTTALSWHLESLRRVPTQTDRWVDVPSATDGPIWARIDLGVTRRDALVAALLAGPLVSVTIRRADGSAATYRIVPALARDGFLLSPVVENTADFMRLFSDEDGHRGGHDAAALTVRLGAAPGIDGGPRGVEIEFFRLVLGA